MNRVLLTTTLLTLAMVLLISISFTFAEKSLTKTEKKAEKQLLLTLNIRKKDIETYYGSIQSEIRFWAKNKIVINGLKRNSPLNKKRLIHLLDQLLAEQTYDNILLTTPKGKIIYSANKQTSTLPTHIHPLLSKIRQEQQTTIYFTDYITTRLSTPQHQFPKQAFITAGIFNQKTLLGVLIMQLSNQTLTMLTKPLSSTNNNIQTLVLGQDKQLRNRITSMPHKIALTALTDGLLVYGNRHVFTIPDQNNKPFLAAFDFAHISKHLTWVIIAKTDAEQITKAIKKQIYHWVLLGISLLLSSLLIGYLGERWMRKNTEGQTG